MKTDLVVEKIKEEARKLRIRQLKAAMAEITKKIHTEGTPQYEHAMEARSIAMREATQRALVTFQAAMEKEREETERRVALAKAKKAMIQKETEALDSLLSSGSFDDPPKKDPPPEPAAVRRTPRMRTST